MFPADTQAPAPPALIHPVTGTVEWTDPFNAQRDNGARRHEGFDMGAPKLRPVVACFDGTVSLTMGMGGLGRSVFLQGDCGWSATYAHLNDDTPGTDDDQGDPRFTFSSGIQNGSHVRAGQLLGYVGNSGNAKKAGSHLHFELHDPNGAVVDPTVPIKKARKLTRPIPASAPAPSAAVAGSPLRLVDFPMSPLSGVIKIELSADPTPRKPTTFYSVCVDGVERLRFRVTPSLGRWDTHSVADGAHTLTVLRGDSRSGATFPLQTIPFFVKNLER